MSEFTGGRRTNDIDFGDFVKIEMHRYGVENEFYLHKVVGSYISSHWIDAPLHWDSEPRGHRSMEKVLNVIQCGIDETKVITVLQKHCRKVGERHGI